MPRSSTRLVLSLVYLAVLFAGIGWVYARIRAFDGAILLFPGDSERVAVRPSSGGLALSADQRGMPLEVMTLENPRQAARYFGADCIFDGATLPGSLQLERIEILQTYPPREALEITGPDGKRELPVKDGAEIEAKDAHATMRGVRPWVGLVRHPKGAPMAAVSLRDRDGGAWGEGILINDGAWASSGAKLAIGFKWRASDAEAAAFTDTRPGADDTRWGVRDGKAMQWIGGTQIGAGVELNDGAVVTLVAFEAAHVLTEGTAPAIEIERRKGNDVMRTWVRANAGGEGPYRFDYPGAAETMLLVQAASDGSAYLRAWRGKDATAVAKIEEGDAWHNDAIAWDLRIDQIMRNALAAPRAVPPVWELLLETPGRMLRLREGELITWGDAKLRYTRTVAMPKCRYHFAFRRDDKSVERFTLEGIESRRAAGWIFSLKAEQPDPVREAVLDARRGLGGTRELIGGAMVVAGAFGLTILRLRKKAS